MEFPQILCDNDIIENQNRKKTMAHPYIKTSLTPLEQDVVVVTNSNTKFSGDKYATIRKGTPITLETSGNGNRWVTWGEGPANEYGYSTHLHRGRIVQMA